MDIERVLRTIVEEFDREGIGYAVIGGFAVGALGVMRTTMDLDFLLAAEDAARMEDTMHRLGYRCVYRTENVSQYVSDVKVLGEVDFVHAFRKASLSMLAHAREVAVFDGALRVMVALPEDVIGLKLQAAVNNPVRESREFVDIEALMEKHGACLDWERVREYFALFDRLQKFAELKGRHGPVA